MTQWHFPVEMSHKQIVLSSDPEAMMAESGEMETLQTVLVAREVLDNSTSLYVPKLDNIVITSRCK
jgi:hypothetical protein